MRYVAITKNKITKHDTSCVMINNKWLIIKS